MKRSCKDVWESCLKVIKDNVNKENYNLWFAPIKAVKLVNNTLTLQVPSPFIYEWLEEHYIDLLRQTIKSEIGSDGKLEYSIIVDNSYGKHPPYTLNLPEGNRSAVNNPPVNVPININQDNSKGIPNPFIIPGLRKIKIDSQLCESKSFGNFIEGDCNRLARSAGYAIANKPGSTSFNPLFIYSETGLGKTHLAHAIGIEIKKQFPDKIVLYISADQFYNQYIDAVKNNNQNDFIHFYRMMDVLIMDDIYFLSGKEKTQDIFFHLFNYLHQNNKQLVLTSDKPPVEMKGIEQRLLSRFKWGLAADLQKPDLETRIAIIKKKLYIEGSEMPDDVILYLAEKIKTNIREIDGAVNSLIAQSSLNKKAITIDLAKKLLSNIIENKKTQITIPYIEKLVCNYFNITHEQIVSNQRKREIVQARQILMYFSKLYTKHSLANIGTHCGNKNHATVLHACKTVKNLVDTNKKFRSYVEDLEKMLKHK